VHGGDGLVDVILANQEDDSVVVLSEVLAERGKERGVGGEQVFGIEELFIESYEGGGGGGGLLRGRGLLFQLVEGGQEEVQFIMSRDVRERIVFIFPCQRNQRFG
jgi:hypothetical protein